MKITPGLLGDLAGSCIACMQGTDTGLGVRGDPEWHAAFLVTVGVPKDEAIAIIEANPNYEAIYRVCRQCAGVNLPNVVPVLLVYGADIPTLQGPS